MRKYFWLIILLLIFSLTSCKRDNIVGTSPQQGSSNLSIGLSMAKAPADISKIEGILSRQGYDTLSSDFVIYNDSAICKFENIPAGQWHLRVNAYDTANTLKYTGDADINIIAGITVPVYLTLNPVTGSINITVTWQNTSSNLITNPSFELNGQPSLNGWIINDTAWVKLINEAPSGQGSWCLALITSFGPLPGGTAATSVTGQNGNSSYTLSFSEMNKASYYWGVVNIEQHRNGSIIYNTNLSADTSSWSPFKKTFEMNLMPTDTIVIKLGSMSLVLHPGTQQEFNADSTGVFYDGISLIKN